MNIVFVGIDDDYVVKLAQTFAELMKFEFVNFEKQFKKILDGTKELSLKDFNIVMGNKESEEIKRLSLKSNCVIAISNNSFLSNKNYYLFRNDFTICIENNENEKIIKNIQKLIKKHSKMSLKQEKIDLNQLKNNIFRKIK